MDGMKKKDDETLPSVACAVASIFSDSDDRTVGKDDGTLPSVAAVASISSGSDPTPLDNDDKTLPLVAAATSLLSSGELSKDERIGLLPSMAGAASTSLGDIKDLEMVNIQCTQGSAIGQQFKDCTFEKFVVTNLPVQVVQNSTPGNQGNIDDTIRDYLVERLKTLCSKANRFTPATWNSRFQVDIAHMFTGLDLLKENTKKQDAKPTTLQEVLDIITSTPACRVFMDGEGGIGVMFGSYWYFDILASEKIIISRDGVELSVLHSRFVCHASPLLK